VGGVCGLGGANWASVGVCTTEPIYKCFGGRECYKDPRLLPNAGKMGGKQVGIA
jgi:hypothetical protein